MEFSGDIKNESTSNLSDLNEGMEDVEVIPSDNDDVI